MTWPPKPLGFHSDSWGRNRVLDVRPCSQNFHWFLKRIPQLNYSTTRHSQFKPNKQKALIYSAIDVLAKFPHKSSGKLTSAFSSQFVNFNFISLSTKPSDRKSFFSYAIFFYEINYQNLKILQLDKGTYLKLHFEAQCWEKSNPAKVVNLKMSSLVPCVAMTNKLS